MKITHRVLIRSSVCLIALCLIAGCVPREGLPLKERRWQKHNLEPRQKYLQNLEQALEQVQRQLDGKKRHPLEFSANLFFAHGAAISSIPLDTLKRYVDALDEVGVNRIDINLGLIPWFEGDRKIINKYDVLIKYIRSRQLGLVLNPQYTRGEIEDFNFQVWKNQALRAYEMIAKAYRPDIFVVIHEPTTMAKRMNQSISPKQWSKFAQEACDVVKRSSSSTRCGAGFLSHELEYFKEMLPIEKMDTISIDIYSLKGLKANNSMIQQARSAGKRVYIEETWRPPFISSRHKPATLEDMMAKGIGNVVYQELDAKWLEVITQYASVWGLEAVTPFWTQTFFTYVSDGQADGALDPNYNRRVIQAINRGKRSETFHAFKRLIKATQ